MAFVGFVGFFFPDYTTEEKMEQKKWKSNKPDGDRHVEHHERASAASTENMEKTPTVEEQMESTADLFARWKKSPPFNLNLTLANSVILLPSDPLDVFIEIPLLDVSNRYTLSIFFSNY